MSVTSFSVKNSVLPGDDSSCGPLAAQHSADVSVFLLPLPLKLAEDGVDFPRPHAIRVGS